MTLLEYFGIKEAYRLPDAIMDALLSDKAEKAVSEIKRGVSCNILDMFQEEQGDRKNLKQDFTPDCICSMVAKMMVGGTCLDMCSGTGALSKAAALEKGTTIHEIEFSERTVPFALLDACLSGLEGTISRGDCLRGTVLESYRIHKTSGGISIPRLQEAVENPGKFDNVIMNPPYSMKFPEADNMPIMGHKIPKSKADYGFVLRGLEHLADTGRLIAILPHGVLFRGQGEGKIREWMIQEHMVNAVIGLPDNLFLNTGIPVCLLILERGSPDILFIDASKDFIKKPGQNDMTDTQADKVVDAFHNRKEIGQFSHIASYQEIEKNDFNLNITRYVDSFVPEALPDAWEILQKLKQIEQEEQDAEKALYNMLTELTGSPEDMRIVEGHKNNIKQRLERKHRKPDNTQYKQMELFDYGFCMQKN